FTKDPGSWIVMQLMYLAAMLAVIGFPIFFVLIPAGVFASRNEAAGIAAAAGIFILLIPVIFVVALLAVAYLWSGMFRTAIRQARGDQISAGDLFSGGSSFLRVLGVLALGAIAQFVIMIVFAIPGFFIEELGNLATLINSFVSAVINGLLYFAIPLVGDRNAGVMEAISTSIETTKSQWWMFAIFAFVVAILSGIGVLACFIGLLATAPFYFTVPAVAYRDTFGLQGAQSYDMFPTPPPPPSYQTPSYQTTPVPPDYQARSPQPQFSNPTQPQFSNPSEPIPPHAQETQLIGKACPTCGATITRIANFCNQCGSQLPTS